MKKRISILLVMMMVFSMASSFVFAEGMDAESVPAEEPAVEGTVEGTAAPEDTPEEVAAPVAEGEENAEKPEEGEATGEENKLEAKDVDAEAIPNVAAALVGSTNSVKVTWTAVESTDVPEVKLVGPQTYTSTGLAAGASEYTQTDVAAGDYSVTVTVGAEIGTASITVPEMPDAFTSFETFSAYKSVVLEWNKPASGKNPTRYEVWCDGKKAADITNPISPYDRPEVYYYQFKKTADGTIDAGDEKFHTYFIKAVNVSGTQEVSVQTEVKSDQMLMPMYIKCTFNQKKTLTSHDKAKAKHTFKKGDVITAHMFVKGQYRFYYNGNLYHCNYNRLTKKKALYNGYQNWNYSDREAEYFINTAGETSMTKYLIFVNLYTQHLYLMKGTPKSKGQWKITTETYKGKKYRDWEVASGKAATPTPGGLKLTFKGKPVNIYRKSGTVYGHKTKNWNFYHSQTALHGRVGKNIYGKPRSLGCIRNTDAQAIFIKKCIPMKTRVAIY